MLLAAIALAAPMFVDEPGAAPSPQVCADTHEGCYSNYTALADLEKRLPAGQFARVHRAAIVRLDLVREVRSRGHGDADLVLRDGDVVRLSRRYRKNLTAVAVVS